MFCRALTHESAMVWDRAIQVISRGYFPRLFPASCNTLSLMALLLFYFFFIKSSLLLFFLLIVFFTGFRRSIIFVFSNQKSHLTPPAFLFYPRRILHCRRHCRRCLSHLTPRLHQLPPPPRSPADRACSRTPTQRSHIGCIWLLRPPFLCILPQRRSYTRQTAGVI